MSILVHKFLPTKLDKNTAECGTRTQTTKRSGVKLGYQTPLAACVAFKAHLWECQRFFQLFRTPWRHTHLPQSAWGTTNLAM